MSTRTVVLAMGSAWLIAFLLLMGIELVAYGLEPGSVPGNIFMSFMASPLGLLYLWARNRRRGHAR